MKFFLSLLAGVLAGSTITAAVAVRADSPAPTAPIIRFADSVPGHYSQGPDIQAAAVGNIEAARHSVRLAAYSLTDRAICEALARARGRGVDVEVVMDHRLDASGKALRFLQLMRVPVAVLDVPGLMHEKVLITDGQHVMAGSYNWTLAARDRNCEVSIEWDDPGVAAQFAGHFDGLWVEAQRQAAERDSDPP